MTLIDKGFDILVMRGPFRVTDSAQATLLPVGDVRVDALGGLSGRPESENVTSVLVLPSG